MIEGRNETLQNMLEKCVNGEKTNWSQQLPYVQMAYRSSEHESTGYTPQFLVFGQKLSLLLDCMYPNLQENETNDFPEFVHNKQEAFQRVFELVRRNLNENQKSRNTIYSKTFHGPAYKEGQKDLLYHPALPDGTTLEFASSWKGPYIIEHCLSDVAFKINEENSSKQQIVHYDPLKPIFEPLQTSTVPAKNNPKTFQSTQDIAHRHQHIAGKLNHDDCLSFLPAPSSVLTAILVVRQAIATILTSRITPITSSALARREVAR